MKIMLTGPKGHRTVRLVLHWFATMGAASALLVTGLTIVTSSSASAVPTVSVSGGSRSPLATQVAQAPLKITSTSGTVGTALALTTSGGSGTGAVTFVINSSGTAGCLISDGKLDATKAGTCTLTATKAADATYLAASSPATTVTFASAPLKMQAPLKLTSTSGTAGTALALTTSGGSGTGAVTYVINSSGTAGCLISYGKLDATKAGTCTLTATKAADATYLAASSPSTTVTFAAKVIAARLTCRAEYGLVRIGRTVFVSIFGTHFYSKPTIGSNQAGTNAVVIHDHGTQLVVRVSLRRGSAQGRYVFTVTVANGHSCKVQYLVR
jgi:hypothetical protein